MGWRFKLWKIKRSLAPSADFRRVLWARLESVWDTEHQIKISWYYRPRFKLAVAGVAVLVLAGNIVTVAYAYAAPEVTEGSALYPIKQAAEAVEEKLQTTSEAKAKFILKKISRREAEKRVLISRKKPIDLIDNKIKKLEDRLAAAHANINAYRGYRNPKLKTAIEARLTQHQDK